MWNAYEFVPFNLSLLKLYRIFRTEVVTQLIACFWFPAKTDSIVFFRSVLLFKAAYYAVQ